MSISFSYADGLIMKALGRVAAAIKNQDAHLAAQLLALAGDPEGVVAQLDEEPDIQAVTGGGYVGALSGAGAPVGQLMQRQAAAIADRYVYRDSPRAGQTLTQQAVLASLQELLRQMAAGGQSVRAQTVSSPGLTVTTGAGDAALLLSLTRPADGRRLENAFAETLNCLCVADSFTGGATAYQEQYRVNGAGRQPDVFAFDWPRGSGASVLLNAIDGALDAAGGNLLTNGGFDTWSAGLPAGWDLATGVAGTDVSQETGAVARPGGSALKLTGDDATQVRLRRAVSGVTPLTQYGCCLRARRDGVAPAAGVLTVSLQDEGGTTLLDAAGAPCSFATDLTALSTQYAASGAAFRTPRQLPAAVYIDLKLTTPLTAGRSAYIDLLSLGQMRQLYTHGPFASVHSGGAAGAANDLAQAAVTNGRGAGGTLSTWQTAWYRLFPDAQSNELLLPSSGSPTIDDAWIA